MSGWVSAFGLLAARKAPLLRVYGELYDDRCGGEEDRPWPEERWRAGWLAAVGGSRPPLECDWPTKLWLEFADYPVLELSGPPNGEGFEFLLQDQVPREAAETRPGDFFVKELTHLPPFVPVSGTRLQSMRVLAWLVPKGGGRSEPTSRTRPARSGRWGDRLPNDLPVGVRLQFDAGDVWIMNIADEIEIYYRRPPLWEEEAHLTDLREWEYST